MTAEEAIHLRSWSGDAVDYVLKPADPGTVRSLQGPSTAVPPECEPRVALPTAGFDCIALDALRDHPAVHPLVRAELDVGVPFRILRFPLALHRPQRGRIIEARYTLSLRSARRNGARVYSIFPQRIEVEHEKSSEVSIEPTLKLGSALEIRGAKLGRKIITQQARSTVVGYWSEVGAEWSIRALDDEEGLDGTWDFLVIVRWHNTVTPLRIGLALSATVETPHSLMAWRTRRIERLYETVRVTGCTSIA